MDMLTYNDSSIYTKTTFVNSFLANVSKNVYCFNNKCCLSVGVRLYTFGKMLSDNGVIS